MLILKPEINEATFTRNNINRIALYTSLSATISRANPAGTITYTIPINHGLMYEAMSNWMLRLEDGRALLYVLISSLLLSDLCVQDTMSWRF